MPALSALKSAFYGTDDPDTARDKRITIEVKDAGRQ
jgi:hypothetical protein